MMKKPIKKRYPNHLPLLLILTAEISRPKLNQLRLSADYDNLPAPQAGPSVEPAVYPPLDTAEITVEPTASEKSPSDQV